MADDVLRGLERRYRDTGALDDHAKWIAGRMRSGELDVHRVKLAADLGHPAAHVAIGQPAAVTLEQAIETLDGVCLATRAPAAHAEASWILTGEPPPSSTPDEAPLEEGVLEVRVALAAARAACLAVPLEGEWRRGLERLDRWLLRPGKPALRGMAAMNQAFFGRGEQPDVDPPWTPFLSREEVLAAVLPESRGAVTGHLDRLEATWRENNQPGEAEEWPGIDLWWQYRLHMWAIDGSTDVTPVTREVELLRELARSPRSAAMLACCAAFHAGTSSTMAVRLTVKAAVMAAGEVAVRGALARDVGPWLLREEPVDG